MDDSPLQFMLDVGEMARKTKTIRTLRVRQLTCDAAILFIIPVVYLTRYLLSCANGYVIFWGFD